MLAVISRSLLEGFVDMGLLAQAVVVFPRSSLLNWAARHFVRELSQLAKDEREEPLPLLARNESPAPARLHLLQASDLAPVAGVCCIGTELDDKDAPAEESKRDCRASAMEPA
jgi:hypothetical protein